MGRKTCTICNIEEDINKFYKKYSEWRDCNRATGLKRYYEIIEKISNQQKLYYEKNREKILLQKKNNRCIQIRDLVRSYAEIQKKIRSIGRESQIK